MILMVMRLHFLISQLVMDNFIDHQLRKIKLRSYIPKFALSIKAILFSIVNSIVHVETLIQENRQCKFHMAVLWEIIVSLEFWRYVSWMPCGHMRNLESFSFSFVPVLWTSKIYLFLSFLWTVKRLCFQCWWRTLKCKGSITKTDSSKTFTIFVPLLYTAIHRMIWLHFVN